MSQLEQIRESRAERRRANLDVAVSEAKSAILNTYANLGPRFTYTTALQQATRAVRKRQEVGISPILITIILQLLPILIRWFIDNRTGFMEDIDNVSRDIALTTSRCITPSDFKAYRQSIEVPEQETTDPVRLRNLARVIAIAAILHVLAGCLSWWTK